MLIYTLGAVHRVLPISCAVPMIYCICLCLVNYGLCLDSEFCNYTFFGIFCLDRLIKLCLDLKCNSALHWTSSLAKTDVCVYVAIDLVCQQEEDSPALIMGKAQTRSSWPQR